MGNKQVYFLGIYKFDYKMKTTVVNVRYGPCDVYIGRGKPKADNPLSIVGILLSNPYRIGIDGTRKEVIKKYKERLLSRPDLLTLIPTLKGKKLGCWCKPKACHGDVIVELLESPQYDLFGDYLSD